MGTHCADCVDSGGDQYPTFFMHLEFDNGPIEAIARCLSCGRFLLLEMIDWAGPRLQERVYRLSEVDATAMARFAHDVERGYCDVNRIRNEWYALATTAQLLDKLLVLDVANEVKMVQARVDLADIPRAYGRDLVLHGAGQWHQRLIGRH